MTNTELKLLLEEKYEAFCQPAFIESDPISVPHQFEDRQDVEISGLLVATIAWGQRPSIVRNANEAMRRMGNEPFRFVMEHSGNDLRCFDGFVHRTFQAEDLKHFVRALRSIYTEHASLEDVFVQGIAPGDVHMGNAIHSFKQRFFAIAHPSRTRKHIADPLSGSSAKRLNMFLRWMVRPNDKGVDLGLWNKIPTAILSCPLDVHSGRIARQLGLLKRRQNDWKAVQELDTALRSFNADDPVRYDYALFGMGVFG